jgi:hypothetical protein
VMGGWTDGLIHPCYHSAMDALCLIINRDEAGGWGVGSWGWG